MYCLHIISVDLPLKKKKTEHKLYKRTGNLRLYVFSYKIKFLLCFYHPYNWDVWSLEEIPYSPFCTHKWPLCCQSWWTDFWLCFSLLLLCNHFPFLLNSFSHWLLSSHTLQSSLPFPPSHLILDLPARHQPPHPRPLLVSAEVTLSPTKVTLSKMSQLRAVNPTAKNTPWIMCSANSVQTEETLHPTSLHAPIHQPSRVSHGPDKGTVYLGFPVKSCLWLGLSHQPSIPTT